MGAVQERWYPPQKDNELYGLYFAFHKDDWYPNNEKYHNYGLMKFHDDYNWLMKVVEKILEKEYEGHLFNALILLLQSSLENANKHDIVMSVNNFIDVYNYIKPLPIT